MDLGGLFLAHRALEGCYSMGVKDDCGVHCWENHALGVLEPRTQVVWVCFWELSVPSLPFSSKQVAPFKRLQDIMWFPHIFLVALLLVGCSLLNDCPALLTLSRTCDSTNGSSSYSLMWFLETFFVSSGLLFSISSSSLFF